uniref:Coiled-coil domain-containing protein 86 n=1 Tax=Albugo laibachii Nc14 TaxID=890382 RepID=F0WYK1_9STRA|nr:conserved hypothetical protein [Albugo laibachii Nc14]|eukprot:CCA26559.1 conserved hypothetical protein [Albugo laibachii Nc14]
MGAPSKRYPLIHSIRSSSPSRGSVVAVPTSRERRSSLVSGLCRDARLSPCSLLTELDPVEVRQSRIFLRARLASQKCNIPNVLASFVNHWLTITGTMTTDAFRGRTKSGRCWKKNQTGRFSSTHLKVSRTLSTTWEKKLEQRGKKQELQRLQSDIRERQDQLKEEKKRHREEKQKRRQKNELKSMSVQSLSKPHRIKSMSKKQLRNIRKSVVNKQGVVEYVPVY